MSERVEMWKTDDGKLWVTEEEAGMHEKRTVMTSILNDLFYRGMIECGDHLLDFLNDHKPIILQYYGIEK